MGVNIVALVPRLDGWVLVLTVDFIRFFFSARSPLFATFFLSVESKCEKFLNQRLFFIMSNFYFK